MCKGSGSGTVGLKKRTCPKCGGSGVHKPIDESKRCKECQGSGLVGRYTEHEFLNTQKYVNDLICPKCGGTGKRGWF
jgi:DnaJ-class molecular chaperone